MALDLEPINRQNTVDTLLRQLLDRMLSGKLKPGDKLPGEIEMAAQLGASRNSIREAFKVLQTLGILERRQGDGTYVAESYKMPFDWVLFPLLSRLETSQDLVELRHVLESGIAELVIEKATPEDFDALEEKKTVFESITRRAPLDADEVVQADVEFHLTLARITRNDAIEELAKLVFRLVAPSMKAHLTSPDGTAHAIHDHRAVLDALKMRSRDQAQRCVVAAFEHWRRFIGFDRGGGHRPGGG